jgi:hypothetical protein
MNMVSRQGKFLKLHRYYLLNSGDIHCVASLDNIAITGMTVVHRVFKRKLKIDELGHGAIGS